ncbi:MAG: DUF3106 domain-containing protein [Pseudomonadota bacterium]|nr:DUF3106 domain-containing protein [Pseudomonadota bacterium]
MRPLLLTTALALGLIALAGTPALAQPAAASAGAAAGDVAWTELSAEQKAALSPLAALWPTLGGEHQRKWVALAYNYSRLTPEEQATLQSRMAEWASLTPAQRRQARLNFGEVRRALPADERRAKWEEYQALPPQERERLAKDRPLPPAGATHTVRPTEPDKILRRPGLPAPDGKAAPGTVNRRTLLPEPPPPAQPPER